MMNHLRTFILLAGLTALFLAIGYALGGSSGAMMAFMFALATNFFAYWNSDKIVLRMYRAQPVDENSSVYQLVSRLATRAEIPMPKVYVIDNPQPNAFATGRNPEHGAVAVTTGILHTLNERELAGVIAHELGHIKNRDTLTMTITATIAGAIGMLANFAMFFSMGNRQNNGGPGPIAALAMMILAPIAAMLVQMAISRSREYAADRTGAEVSEDPLALASALEKISSAAKRVDNYDAERNPATAHMFIINPLHGRSMDSLFSTHPNTENRIRALREIAGSMPTSPSQQENEAGWVKGPWG